MSWPWQIFRIMCIYIVYEHQLSVSEVIYKASGYTFTMTESHLTKWISGSTRSTIQWLWSTGMNYKRTNHLQFISSVWCLQECDMKWFILFFILQGSCLDRHGWTGMQQISMSLTSKMELIWSEDIWHHDDDDAENKCHYYFVSFNLIVLYPSHLISWCKSDVSDTQGSVPLGGKDGWRYNHRRSVFCPSSTGGREGLGEKVRWDQGTVRDPKSGSDVPHAG